MLLVKYDAMLVIINVWAILKIILFIVKGYRNDTMILSGWVRKGSCIAFIFKT